MKQKHISIVLCNYNYGDYIKYAIESVIYQKYYNYELIIVDDGSTDNSRDIISKCATRYPEIIKSIFQKNKGQAEAFNVGFNHSKGEIICFLDSDDVWMPGKMQAVNSCFSTKNNIALFQHNMIIMENGSITDKLFKDVLEVGDVYKEACNAKKIPQFVPTSGLSFHRSILENVMPIPEEFRICADGYLTRTTMCFGNVRSEFKPYAYYRQHKKNNILGNKKHKNDVYVHKILIPQLNKFYERKNIPLRFPMRAYNTNVIEERLSFVRMQAKSAKNSNALDLLKQTIKQYPDDYKLRPYTYGCIFQQLGLYHDAISCFKRTDLNNINYLNAKIEMASCYNALKLNYDALEIYEYVIEHDPTCIPALLGMAYTLLLCNDFKASEKIKKEIDALNPELNIFELNLK